ncbi:MAG TPA: hypothetical protein VK745_29515 [Polyangiaceae bacterium]|nr:hypothetical protein [Polyangiaceae bacterium]
MRAPGLCLMLLALGGCGRVIGLSDDYYVIAGTTAAGGAGASSASAGAGGTSDADAGLLAGSGGASGESALTVPPGKLVFERYTTYDAGDSQMYVVTFPGGTIGPELGVTYGLCTPLNGIFSPDGTHMVLGATIRGDGPCPVLDRTQLELFILDLQNPGQKQRITNNMVPDEDAQYSPAGDYVLFKHNGNLARWVTGSAGFDETCADPAGSFCFNHAYAAANDTEQSKPVTDGNGLVCYGWGNSGDVTADIFCFQMADGLAGKDITDPSVRMPAIVHTDLSDARPTIAPPYLYFTRWRAPSSHVNEIGRTLLSDITGPETIGAFCTDPGVGYEDAFSLDGADLVVFSSNANGLGKGDLFIGNFSQPMPADLNDFAPGVNTVNDELGAAFWRAP